jgi:hypothetical protein
MFRIQNTTSHVWIRALDDSLIRGDAVERIFVNDTGSEILIDTIGGQRGICITITPTPDRSGLLADAYILASHISEPGLNEPDGATIIEAVVHPNDDTIEWQVNSMMSSPD